MMNQRISGLIKKSPGPCLAAVGNLVEDILLIKKSFTFLKFSFVSKSCNKTTHVLATEALSSNTVHVWLEDYPDCILDRFILFNKS